MGEICRGELLFPQRDWACAVQSCLSSLACVTDSAAGLGQMNSLHSLPAVKAIEVMRSSFATRVCGCVGGGGGGGC